MKSCLPVWDEKKLQGSDLRKGKKKKEKKKNLKTRISPNFHWLDGFRRNGKKKKKNPTAVCVDGQIYCDTTLHIIFIRDAPGVCKSSGEDHAKLVRSFGYHLTRKSAIKATTVRHRSGLVT